MFTAPDTTSSIPVGSITKLVQPAITLRLMKAITTWIVLNPSAVKSYLLAVLALVAKGILAITGKTADMGQYAGFIDQAIDLLVGGLSIYGVIAGSIHASRGPPSSPTDQAATIVAALAPAPVPVAVEQVKAIVADVVAVKTVPVETVESPHKF